MNEHIETSSVAPSNESAGSESTTPRRGFAAMSPDVLRSISSRGGRSAHKLGVAHRFTSAEAADAGRKGGHASAAKRRQARQQDSS
jgi:general stress protein YciG